MTNPTKIIAENESPEPTSQSLQTELSVVHKATVVESRNSERLSDNDGENTLPASVPEPDLPSAVPEENRTALFQKRQELCPARTARLDELAKVGDDLAAVARKYQSDHRLLCNDLFK